MSRVEVHGHLPAVGREADKLAIDEAERLMHHALRTASGVIEAESPWHATARPLTSGNQVEGVVKMSPWFWRFSEFGTGVYNRKRGKPIVPKRGRSALKLPGGYRASVPGIRPKHQVRRARTRVRPEIERLFEHGGALIAEVLANSGKGPR